MKIVIDTDIFIDHLRHFGSATDFIKGTEAHDTYFSAITEAEILSGQDCDSEDKRRMVIALLSRFSKIHVDNTVAKLGGEIRRKFGLELDDALIAATAIKTGAVLVTRNVKDFKRIEGLEVKSPY